ncbi:MAG TPA: ATP-grasp domain-containing protein [Burkholderiales bacterium]
MSNILFLCPTHRDYREIEVLGLHQRHRIRFHDYASLLLEELVAHEPPPSTELADPRDEIRRILACYRGAGIDGVVSTDDYPGSSLAAIVAAQLGLPGVAPAVNLRCQHKYFSRLDQQRFAPQATPAFQLCAQGCPRPPSLPYPVFVKPVKSFFSVGAYRVGSDAEFLRVREKSDLGAAFFDPFATLLKEYTGLDFGARTIVEDLLQGFQVTVEGYAQNGNVHVIGVVDSIMFPNTLSFQRFEYPSSLAPAVQRRMADIARAVIAGIGFDHGLLNIEMMYDPDRDSIHIIEINPRMASQFADLYEKVDGTNTYEVLFDLALGKSPVVRHRQGAHRYAASCVLRTFENAFVARVPDAEEIAQLHARYPDVRVEVLATAGRRLSQEMQDGGSYRYGIVNIGGRDRDDVLATFERCRADLRFVLERVDARPDPPFLKVASA